VYSEHVSQLIFETVKLLDHYYFAIFLNIYAAFLSDDSHDVS